MSTKVEQASRVELGLQKSVTSTSSIASTSVPKILKFTAKAGFVIPKNKLSGSLVPIFRDDKKLAGSDPGHEENAKQVQRKTKWGPDPTQDAAVRKGRALAYQTRVDQITQQLKSAIVEREDNQVSPLPSQDFERESSLEQEKKSEILELERREAIGEILKLNPSYKAPADYKPLLKEAKVPIPIKEYPGYNFIGLIYGTASANQKRLEKETGAKLRVYGTKAETGEKVEINPSDGNETQSTCREMYVHVCADTYEKVDAAVALIEILVNPVSVNPKAVSETSTAVSGDGVNLGQGASTSDTISSVLVNQGDAQSIVVSGQAPQQGFFQPYPSPWFPRGPPSDFVTPQISSAPNFSHPVQVSSSPLNPSTIPSLFGPRPVLASGYSSATQNSPSRPQPTQQVLQHPYMPPVHSLGYTGPMMNPPVPSLPSTPAQPILSAPPPFTINHPTLTGPPQIARTLLTPAGTSAGWSNAPAGTPTSLGPSNMSQMAPPRFPPQGNHHPVAPAFSPANMVPPLTLPFRPPPSSSTAANPPILAPAFSSVAQPQMGIAPYAPTPTQSSIAPMQPVKAWTVPPNYMSGSMRVPSPVTSTSIPPLPPQSGMLTSSGTAPSFTPIRSPTATAPKPLQTNSSDFTFQPHRPQNPPSQASLRPGSQPPPQNLVMQPPQVPQTLSFPTAMDNFARPPIMHGFQQPQASNLLSQPRAHLPPSSAGNPISSHSLSRHPAFTNPSVVTPSQIELRNFGPAPRTFNPAGHLPPRPAIPLQLQQNYPAMAAQPRGLLAPNQQPSSSQPFLSGKPASVSGLQPIYDPFSPTSVSRVPQLGANSPQVKKQENDPEYDDLMASVGVK